MILQRRFPNIVALMLLTGALSTLTGAESGSTNLRGTVYDSQHRPVAEADVSLHGANTQIWKTRTTANGAFTFSALPPGRYTIRAEDSRRKASASVILANDQPQTIDLILSDSDLAFFDEPNFSVAGVTDTTNLGGHGSNAVVQTKNALAKATVSLGKSTEVAPSETSESALREAQKQSPRSFAANFALAKFLFDSGRAADAKPYLARASEIELGDTSLKSKERAGLHHLKGKAAELSGDPVSAVHEYQRAAELDPNESNVFDWGAELLVHHAPEPATEVFTKGHRLFPQSARILVGLGIASYIRGSYQDAEIRLCEASDLAPDNPTPYLFLGKILAIESSVSPQVAERIERFSKRQPQNALANFYFAMSLWKQRKETDDREIAAKVQALLEKAVALDPHLSEAYLQLGIVHFERKELPQAIAAYQRAINVDSRLEQAHYRLAQAYRLSGQNEKAQDELKVFDTLSREKETELERERSDVKQFVYTMQEKESTGPQP